MFKNHNPNIKGYFTDDIETICENLGVPNRYSEYKLRKIVELRERQGSKKIHSYKVMHFIHNDTDSLRRVYLHIFAMLSHLGLSLEDSIFDKYNLVVHHVERTRDNNHISALILTTYNDNLKMDGLYGDEIEQYYINKMQSLVEDIQKNGLDPEAAILKHYINKPENDLSPGEVKRIATANIYLIVDYKEISKVKARGARWDLDKKRWYVPAGQDVSRLRPWLPVDCMVSVNEVPIKPVEGEQKTKPRQEAVEAIIEKLNFEVSD